jgi:RecG-like helicase
VLEAGIEALDGVGPKLADVARLAGISTVGDLLYRFPHRHRDRQIRPLDTLESGETGTVLVTVLGNPPRPFRRGKLIMVGVKVGDETDHVRATWFNQPWISGKLEKGSQILITGKRSPKGLAVQEWELVAPAGKGTDLWTMRSGRRVLPPIMRTASEVYVLALMIGVTRRRGVLSLFIPPPRISRQSAFANGPNRR